MITAHGKHTEDTGGAGGDYERLVSARGGRTGTDALLRFAQGDRSMQHFSAGNADSASLRLGAHLHKSHGPTAVLSGQASIKSIDALSSMAVFDPPCHSPTLQPHHSRRPV